ncbi:MAG: isoprenylcysteine carboxylmethyltransferase family protein [Candidatus Lokiarchaeota archaeon]|nr:isoprenylcysteine carboxylmethyltransferase family protein [Candidatus Lokiarchaeota archaeon]
MDMEPGVAQLLAGIGFFSFVFDFTYVLAIKRRNKPNGGGNGSQLVVNHSLLARIGIVVLDVMICLCCVMVFTFRYVHPLVPRVWAGEGAAVVQVVGFTLVAGGDVVLFLAYRALGVYWAYPLDGKTGKHKLVKEGPYKYVRHPVYDSFGIIAIGFVLLFLDWFLLVLCVVSVAGLYAQAIDEEKALVAYFGDDYASYMRETGRFFSRRRS